MRVFIGYLGKPMTEKTVEIGGVSIQVMDRDVGPDDVVVCVRAADIGPNSPFSDNQQAPCMVCGVTVSFRPYMAVAKKMCMQCMVEQTSAGKPH